MAPIAIVLVINASQLRGGFWKRPPLYGITVTLGAVAVGYLWLLTR
jgi:hypothetical protein